MHSSEYGENERPKRTLVDSPTGGFIEAGLVAAFWFAMVTVLTMSAIDKFRENTSPKQKAEQPSVKHAIDPSTLPPPVQKNAVEFAISR